MSNHNTYRSSRNLRGNRYGLTLDGVMEPLTPEEQADSAAKHQDWLRSLGLGHIADRLAAEDATKVANKKLAKVAAALAQQERHNAYVAILKEQAAAEDAAKVTKA